MKLKKNVVLLTVVLMLIFGCVVTYVHAGSTVDCGYSNTVTEYFPDTHTLVLAGDVSNETIQDAVSKTNSSIKDVMHIVVSNAKAVIVSSNIFQAFNNVVDIDLSGTSLSESISSLESTFAGCNSLISLKLGDSFDTSHIVNMRKMFYNCNSLVDLQLGDRFDTSKVEIMEDMFSGCKSIESCDFVKKFNTSNAVQMNEMFCNCYSLSEIDLGDNFDTSKVTNISGMFSGCYKVKTIRLGRKFNTYKVTNMSSMFSGCLSVTSISLGYMFDTMHVANMNKMFFDCRKLVLLNLGCLFNTDSLVTAESMFENDSSLRYIYTREDFNANNVSDSYAFYNCTSLCGSYGTSYSSQHTDLSYAKLDGGHSKPGYFSTFGYSTMYHVRDMSDENGKVLASPRLASENDTVYLFPEPNIGYEMVDCKVLDSSNREIELVNNTFVMPNSNVRVFPVYSQKQYKVIVQDSIGGTISISCDTAGFGDRVNISSALDEGYYYAKYSVFDSSGRAVSINGGYFLMPASDVVVSASYTKTPHDIIVNKCDHGYIEVSRIKAGVGDEVTITAYPSTGYELDYYSVSSLGSSIPVKDSKFIMPMKSVNVSAKFKKVYRHLYVDDEIPHGRIELSKTAGYYGDQISVEAFPDPGYRCAKYYLTYNGATQNVGKVFSVPHLDAVVSAQFVKIDYRISFDSVENGKISATNSWAVAGEKVYLSASPDAGYEVDKVILSYGSSQQYIGLMFDMPASNVTVSAVFKKRNYSISVDTVQNGLVEVSESSAHLGDKISVLAYPDEGYEIDDIKVYSIYGQEIGLNNGEFLMPSTDVVVSASFKRKVYSITVDYDSSQVMIDGINDSVLACEYDDYVFKVSPINGYRIICVKANENLLIPDSAGYYRVSQPAADLLISVLCETAPVEYAWKQISGKWYYIGSDGTKTIGFAEIDGNTYFFDASGVMKTGWQLIDSKYYYFNKSGVMQFGWIQISKVWYYLDQKSGVMAVGVQEIDGKLYWFKASGALASGWYKNNDGSYYYFTTSGAVTGWKQISKTWYYFNKADAKMVTGAQLIDGSIYIFSTSGAMLKSGWKQVNNDWYYLAKSGSAYVNKWLKSSKKWYYFDANGIMVTGTSMEINGKLYDFDLNGVCKNP